MAIAASAPRTTTPRQTALPVRPSGVMPAFRGSVSLPAPSRIAPRPAPKPSDDGEWAAALAAAKQRALEEEERREWEALRARAQAQLAEEEREWAALRARAQAPRRAARRLHSWP